MVRQRNSSSGSYQSSKHRPPRLGVRLGADQRGSAWVAVVVVLVILGIVGFTWWSVSNSEKQSSEILKPIAPNSTKEPAKESTQN